MGIDTHAIINCSLPPDAWWELPAVLNGDDRLRVAVRELSLATSTHGPQPWQWGSGITRELLAEPSDVWSRGDWFDLGGPMMTLNFRPRICEISCWSVRWCTFLTNETVQVPFRRVSRELARIFAHAMAPQAIYLPDSAFPETAALDWLDGSFAEICKRLERQFGPPRPTIGSMYSETASDGWDSNGYYIDRFEGIAG